MLDSIISLTFILLILYTILPVKYPQFSQAIGKLTVWPLPVSIYPIRTGRVSGEIHNYGIKLTFASFGLTNMFRSNEDFRS
jgi:hypothetical protein